MTTPQNHFVLDRGFVTYLCHMGDDLTVANAARVSFAKRSELVDGKLSDRDCKLLGYLAANKHWTPFGHPQLSLHIKAPLFVRSQLYKHKVGLVESEVSRRYVKTEPDFYTPSWRHAPDANVKQGSGAEMSDGPIKSFLDEMAASAQKDSVERYTRALDAGAAVEQARSFLMESAYTEWWWTGSLAAFSRVYRQRIDPHAQWETRQYARAIGDICEELWPVSWGALAQ